MKWLSLIIVIALLIFCIYQGWRFISDIIEKRKLKNEQKKQASETSKTSENEIIGEDNDGDVYVGMSEDNRDVESKK